MVNNLRLWSPSDPADKPRIVELLAIYHRRGLVDGALIRETNKPLRGMAIVPVYELRMIKGVIHGLVPGHRRTTRPMDDGEDR